MITVGMNYEVLEGKDQPFEKQFALVLDTMAKTPGHQKTHLYKNVFHKRSYLIISEWESRATFDAFIQSETFAKVTNWGKQHILESSQARSLWRLMGTLGLLYFKRDKKFEDNS